MLIRTEPTGIDKLTQLGDVNHLERVDDAPKPEKKAAAEANGMLSCIHMVATPRGQVPMLKTMMTTACEKGCNYCPFRAGRSEMKRVTFTPDELAGAFMKIHEAGLVEGIFISSGIVGGGVKAQDRIIAAGEVLRHKHRYEGFLHLKIMPDAETDQIRRALMLADRLSLNLEGPTTERLQALAPGKEFQSGLLERLTTAAQLIREHKQENPRAKKVSIVTQFVVGAVGDTDLELLSVSGGLYRQYGLQRAYFQAFNPVNDTPFENINATPDIRERRLYQASFLLRDYGWDVEEMPYRQDGNLRTDVDPKKAWADAHLRQAPIEMMTAEKHDLMRIPGIGPKNAEAIIRARRQGALRDLSHLRQIGIRAPEQAAAYITLSGRKPPQQLSLF